MMNSLQALGWGIVVFAIVIGVGVTVLGKLSSAIASCPSGFTYQSNTTTTFTNGKCCLTAGSDCSSAGNYSVPSTATQATYYMEGQMNSTSGLASWTPAVIALAIGLLFIGAFMARKGNQY